jgi:hypothetical protein
MSEYREMVLKSNMIKSNKVVNSFDKPFFDNKNMTNIINQNFKPIPIIVDI